MFPKKEDSISEILRFIHIALLCVDVNPDTRPSLDEVLLWFSCFSTPLPEPRIGNQSLLEDETIGYRSLKGKKQIGYCRPLPDMALLCHPCLHVKET
ncbi:hypothetical protein Bca52824_058646 [Brassica carinata]|uniref:Uncharacterized protein n=1 Tax=Brassica carinata TaxID=52824 RepID=A0A8X7UFW1_BRACI|nr:hypothetical protein Bca52824_058646 [Brassica carinata]